AIIVLGHRQAERSVGLRLRKSFVSPFVREKCCQKGMIGLTNCQQMLATPAFFVDQNHSVAALVRSPSDYAELILGSPLAPRLCCPGAGWPGCHRMKFLLCAPLTSQSSRIGFWTVLVRGMARLQHLPPRALSFVLSLRPFARVSTLGRIPFMRK